MAEVTAAGGDLIVRAGWRMVRWLDDDGRPLDIVALLQGSADGVIDRSIKLARHGAAPLSVRLIAIRKPPIEAEKSKANARRKSAKAQAKLSGGTLVAAEWVLLLTTLPNDQFTANDIGTLYRARWCIELAHRAGVQAPEEPDRPGGAAWLGGQRRENLGSRASSDDLVARAAHRGGRGLSPLGTSPLGTSTPRRLTAPTVWRLTCLATKVLLAAICPQPPLHHLAAPALHRHLHEPPRKRGYQNLPQLC